MLTTRRLTERYRSDVESVKQNPAKQEGKELEMQQNNRTNELRS